MSALYKIASAEAILSQKGALGIPTASTSLQLAVSYLQSLQSGCFGAIGDRNQSGGRFLYTFQIRFILLRLDFIDLVTVIRQITREMRITSNGPGKYTRPYLHLTNALRGLVALSSRYEELQQMHGMVFTHQTQSCYALRLLRDLSNFVSRAGRAVFSDVLSGNNANSKSNKESTKATKDDTIEKVLSDPKHPLGGLMQRLYKLVVEPMDGSINPLIRASAMLELIDGIFMAPTPIPRDFVIPKRTWYARLRIIDDPQQPFNVTGSDNSNNKSSDHPESSTTVIIEACPAICFTIYAFGNIPQQLLKQANIPTYTAVLWHRFIYCGSLNNDEEKAPTNEGDATGDNEKESKSNATSEQLPTETIAIPLLEAYSPKATKLAPSGDFYTSILCPPPRVEGWYKLEMRLGCRDITGNEWQIPVENATDKFPTSVRIRVSRTK
jgi:hypothetical protein